MHPRRRLHQRTAAVPMLVLMAATVTAEGTPIESVSSMLIVEDEMSLCVFEAPSHDSVRRAHDRAGVAYQRITQVATPTTGDPT